MGPGARNFSCTSVEAPSGSDGVSPAKWGSLERVVSAGRESLSEELSKGRRSQELGSRKNSGTTLPPSVETWAAA